MTNALSLSDIQGHVDIAILTVRVDEYKAVLERFPSKPVTGGLRCYEYSTVDTNVGRYGLAIVRLTEQGESEAQSVARDVIDDLKPSWIILCGIAGGVPNPEFSLGDVLISSRIHDFTVCAAHEGGRTEYEQTGGPMQPEVNRILGALPGWEERLGEWNSEAAIGHRKPVLKVPRDIRAKALYGDSEWKNKVKENLKLHFHEDSVRPPLYHIAPSGGSNTLVKDTKLLKQWLESARYLTHVEMEAAGVYRAASQFKLPLLCVRGISDIVGYKRNDKWTEYACHSAASFLHALICHGPELSSDYRGIVRSSSASFWKPLPERHDAVALLDWRYRLTNFYGRKDEIEELRSWALLDYPIRVRLLCGPGGAGKTRLAAELCSKLIDKGWTAEFISRGEALDGDFAHDFKKLDRNTLYVFDYPEERTEDLVKLLARLDRLHDASPGVLRILLLSRQNLNWWETHTSLKSASLNYLFDAVEIEIGHITTDHDVLRIFREVCQRLCEKYKLPNPQCTDKAILDWIHTDEELHSLPLFLIAYAIHAVFVDSSCTGLTGGGVIRALVQRERSRVDVAAENTGMGAEAASRLIGLATIAGRLDAKSLRNLADPELEIGLPSADKVVDQARRLHIWRDNCVHPLRPDICGAALLFEILSEREDMAPEWLWCVIQSGHKGMLDKIGRILYDISIIYGRPDRFQNWLINMILADRGRAKKLADLARQRRFPLTVLPFVIVIDRIMVDSAKKDGEEKARWLVTLAYHSWCLGEAEVEQIQEAVEIYRKLDDNHIVGSNEELAEAWHTFSLILQKQQQPLKALKAIRKAIAIRELLSKNENTKNRYELARSLNLMSAILDQLGKVSEAYVALSKALAIHRAIALQASAEMRDELGRVLNNLYDFEDDAEQAQSFLNESVQIRRSLVREQPWRFKPSLADILEFQAIKLYRCNNLPGALKSCNEAVDIYEQLVRVNPRRFGLRLLSILQLNSLLVTKVPDAINALSVVASKANNYQKLFMEKILTDDEQLSKLASTYMQLGYSAAELGQVELGRDVCTNAITLLEDLWKHDPRNWNIGRLYVLVGGYINRGNSVRKSENRADSIPDFTTAIKLCEEGRKEFGANIDIDVGKSIAIANRSIELLKNEDYEKAREDISALLNWEKHIRKELGDKWPVERPYDEFVKSLSVLVDVLFKMKTDLSDETRDVIKMALSIIEGFGKSDDLLRRCDFAKKLQSLGRKLVQKGQKKGYAYLKEGLEYAEEILRFWTEKKVDSRDKTSLLNDTAYFTYWYVDQTGNNRELLGKAESWARECLESVSKKDFELLAYANSTLGEILMLRGERERSEQVLEEALKHLKTAQTLCIQNHMSSTLEEIEGDITRIKLSGTKGAGGI